MSSHRDFLAACLSSGNSYPHTLRELGFWGYRVPLASKLTLAEIGTFLLANAAASSGTVELVDIEAGKPTVVAGQAPTQFA